MAEQVHKIGKGENREFAISGNTVERIFLFALTSLRKPFFKVFQEFYYYIFNKKDKTQ